MLATVGLPLFFLELSFGQFASLGPITIWKINPLMKGLGYAMVSISWIVAIYYNVIISHVMLYLFASFASIPSGLPWVSCDNWWNTPNCLEPDYSKRSNITNATLMGNMSFGTTAAGTTAVSTTEGYTTMASALVKNKTFTPAEEYYDHFVLEISEGIGHANGVNWKLALCLLLAWIIVLICLIRGIQSLGKVVYFTAIFPYVMLTILLIRGVTLPGAAQGIIFYLKPDFSKLKDPRVWSDAATQIFYSLGSCCGGLIAMSSYNKFDHNCYKDSVIVALINCATSIYGGFVIFSILGFMALEKGVDVGEVAKGGPGLAFVVYPEALSRMPAPQLWAIFFFFMMATLGFGSQFSMVECVLSAFTDEFRVVLKNKKASIMYRTAIIIFTFFMGLPMVTRGGIYMLDLVDYSISGFPLLFIGVLEVGVIIWVYGYDRFAADIELMLGHVPNLYWKACWLVVTPAIILITIVFNCIFYKPPKYGDDYDYPYWAQVLGWFIGLFPVMLIVIFFLYRYFRDGGCLLMQEIGRPKLQWGPLMQTNRKDTVYQDITGTKDVGWEFDPETQTFIFPKSIKLGHTPAGSMYNIANVQNYTGPIPMILNVPAGRQHGLNIPKMAKTRSMTNMALLGIQGSRDTARSTPHLNMLDLSATSPVKKPSPFGSMTNLASRAKGSVSNLFSGERKRSPLADEGSAPNSGANTPIYNRSRAGSRASGKIFLTSPARKNNGIEQAESNI